MLCTSVGKTVSVMLVLVNTVFGLPSCSQAEVKHCEHACLHTRVNDDSSTCYTLFNEPGIMQLGSCHTLPSIPVPHSAV